VSLTVLPTSTISAAIRTLAMDFGVMLFFIIVSVYSAIIHTVERFLPKFQLIHKQKAEIWQYYIKIFSANEQNKTTFTY
jgi:hypothetical protein